MTSIPQNLTVLKPEQPQKTNGNGSKPLLKNPFALLTLSDILKRPAQQWLLQGLLQTKTVSMVYGDSNAGKTFLVFDWAIRISEGLDWLGRKTRQGPVLYIAAEGVDGLRNRARAWLQQNNSTSTFGNLYFVDQATHLITDKGRIIDTIEAMPQAPILIVIDTLNMCTLGINENSDAMAEAIKTAHDLKEAYGCHVCIVHHAGKNGDFRGHSSLRCNIDTQLLLAGDDTELMTLTCMKQRDGARKFEPITLARQVIDLGEVDDMGEKVTSCVVVAGTAKITATAISKKVRQALEALQVEGTTTATQWARTLETMYKIPASTFYHTLLPDLLRQDLVFRDGERRKGARYSFTDKGTDLLTATAKITANSGAVIDTVTAATATPFKGSSNAVNTSSEAAAAETPALPATELQPTEAPVPAQLILVSEKREQPTRRNMKLYGPPTRACFKCQTENWYYDDEERIWKCGTCVPPEQQKKSDPVTP